MQPITAVFPLLHAPKKIFITTHYKPDGDAIGSMLGLYHYFLKLGHSVCAVSPGSLPDFLLWMPGVDRLYNFENEPEKVAAHLQNSDLIFCVDLNDFSRTKHMESLLAAAAQPKVLIDHHMLPKPVWDYGISNPDKSSTCEMVYDFINQSGNNALIDANIAACLYTGVLTDTGSFRFPTTTAGVHTMVADLKNKGLEHTPIDEAIHDNWSEQRMRFVGYVLLEKMEIFPALHSGLITLSPEDLVQFSLAAGDTEGLVNLPLSIAGIRFATLIVARKDDIRLSFRSKGDFDVNAFARTYFNGGGHFNASGGSSKETFLETVTRFKKILSEFHPRN